MARTKIVCTLGPASASEGVIRSLMNSGLDVARINFSHGTHEEHAATIALVRKLATTLSRPVAILGDLQGPRIRVGDLDAPVQLEAGDDIVLVHEGLERPGEIPVTYEALATDVSVGDRVLIDDGLIDLVVLDVAAPRVRARVVHGGLLRSHKGMNLPGVAVSAPSITEKDRADIAFAVEQQLDYLALSFVRRAEDISSLRLLIPAGMLVVAKIEKDTALAAIGSIVETSDAVMVARGDLGVELPFEEVPIAQKRIIAVCNALGRPVITATQMLESMVTNPRPTRAEASDVANAILDGTDAVMLSAETAAGAYPQLAVAAMTRIIMEIERRPLPHASFEVPEDVDGHVETEDAIAAATTAAARSIKEHFPEQFAVRDDKSTRVKPTEARTFEWALERFLQEARTLARYK
ncbi:MAG: pyruvate kinase, partial [Gemmatimonadaceae bacterium]|nr:pyruvate kinase [Gemmatimonadaceae bacterium]